MTLVRVISLGFTAMLATGSARAAAFPDCPFAGPMPDYTASAKPQWENWDSRSFRITQDGNDKDIEPEGAVCTQEYDEDPGKTDGSVLEIMQNYKSRGGNWVPTSHGTRTTM